MVVKDKKNAYDCIGSEHTKNVLSLFQEKGKLHDYLVCFVPHSISFIKNITPSVFLTSCTWYLKIREEH